MAHRLHPASDEDRARIGQALRDLRVQNGMVLAEAGAAIGRSGKYLQNIEKGRKRPTEEIVRRLAAVYRVKVDEITGRAA